MVGVGAQAVFRITEDGPQPVGSPSDELLMADDAIFVLVLAVVGLLAGAAAWRLRRRRGVATAVAVALGALATSVVAWQVGEMLGVGPTKRQIADVGARVTASLPLGSPAALAVAPFMAVLATSSPRSRPTTTASVERVADAPARRRARPARRFTVRIDR